MLYIMQRCIIFNPTILMGVITLHCFDSPLVLSTNATPIESNIQKYECNFLGGILDRVLN